MGYYIVIIVHGYYKWRRALIAFSPEADHSNHEWSL